MDFFLTGKQFYILLWNNRQMVNKKSVINNFYFSRNLKYTSNIFLAAE